MKPPRRSGASIIIMDDSDEIIEAIVNLNLEYIVSQRETLTLDSDTLSAWLHALSRRIIEGCTAESDPDACVERFRPFYSALKAVAVNIGALDASLDLSPWHAFEAREDAIENICGLSKAEMRRRLSRLNIGVCVVLLALPLHRSRAPRDNAFMTENSAGETPLMHLLRKHYPPAIVHTLCLRGGGFSSTEWESGAVLGLLTDRGDIETLVNVALSFFRNDFLHRIHLHGREYGESVLQKYCRRCEEPALSDMQLIVEALGEDPQGAAEILRQRAASEGRYLREMLLQMAAYLDERTARRVRPRTTDSRDLT
jgi:hypothetical protein